MSLIVRRSVLSLALSAVTLYGCASEEVTVSPVLTVVAVSLGPLDAAAPPTGVGRRTPIEVRFSRPIAAGSLAAGLVVARGEADDAFLGDLANPPLGEARRARLVPGETALAGDGRRATWTPSVPLRYGARHTLLVGGAVRAADDGRPLAGPLAYGFVTEPAAAGAPTMRLVAPADGGSAPPNLRRMWIALSEAVALPAGAFALSGPAAPAVVAGDPIGCGHGLCVPLDVAGRLQPGGEYRLAVAAGITDAAGRDLVEPEQAPAFRADGADDRIAPVIGQVEPTAADGCLVVRWVSSEPADSRLTATLGAVSLTVHDPTPVILHEVGVRLPPGGGVARFLAASADLAALAAEAGASVPIADLPRVAITELLPNPHGPEPAQEWVELRNLGATPVALAGFVLAAGPGIQSALPPAVLPPGGYAVVGGASYDPFQGEDPPPAPGAVVIHVSDGRVAGGLTNAGEALTLSDGAGRLVSRYGGYLDVGSQDTEGHSVVRVGQDACDVRTSFVLSEGAPTPGTGP
ncbi:MAG TPA: lamin tail domain-containing protein [Polyangia bacterium]|jgi:hypothetical protein